MSVQDSNPRYNALSDNALTNKALDIISETIWQSTRNGCFDRIGKKTRREATSISRV